MKAAQEAQYTKLVLAGEPLTKKEQRRLEKDAAKAKKEEQKEQAHSGFDWNE